MPWSFRLPDGCPEKFITIVVFGIFIAMAPTGYVDIPSFIDPCFNVRRSRGALGRSSDLLWFSGVFLAKIGKYGY